MIARHSSGLCGTAVGSCSTTCPKAGATKRVLTRRGKVIKRHENHPLGTEATLIYNLGPVSWGINKMRRAMGFVFGAAGRAIYSGLVLWDGQVCIPA